jgi:uncharacterized repeat protein (TIGR02543 family)
MGALKDNPFDETAPLVEGFPLSTRGLVFLPDNGALTLSAKLAPDIAAATTLEWTVEPAGIVTIAADGAHVTVTPIAKGQAVITAKITPKEDYVFDEASELASECRVTVLDDFTLNTDKMLFFADDTASQSIEVNLTSQELSELNKVASIVWSAAGTGAQIPAESAGERVSLEKGSAGGESQIDARFVVKEGSEAFFNGNGAYTPPAVVKTFAVPAPVISGTAGNKMLSPGNAPADFSLQMAYPPELDEFAPEAAWTTTAGNIAAVSGGAVSNGQASAALKAKAAGSASVGASLSVRGRSFPAVSQALSVVAYTPPVWDTQSIDISGAVLAGGTLTLTDTTTSTLITAAARRGDANLPTNPNIIWEASPAGKVSIVPETSSNSTGGKIKISGAAEASSVTVTAKSESNPTVKATFTVKVNPITVTITGSPAATVTYNNTLTLNATASLGAIKWSVTGGGDKVSLSVTEGGSTVVSPKGLITADAAIKVRAAAKLKETYYKEHSFTLKPHSFTVAFNANGGTGSMAAQQAVYGSAATLTANTFTRTGYTFNGWAASASGTAVAANGAAISVLNNNNDAQNPNGSVTLYALWTGTPYTVAYNINGGTAASGGAASPSLETGWVYGTAKTLKTLAALKWTRTGPVFLGWDTNKGGGTVVYTDGQSVSNLNAAGETANLYAVWGYDGVAVKIPAADIIRREYNDASSKWETVYVVTATKEITVNAPISNGSALLAGGGGGGGGGDIQPYWRDGKNANGGNVAVEASYSLAAGTYNAVIGAGGAGGKSDPSSSNSFVFGRVGGTGGATELKDSGGTVLLKAAGGLGGRGSENNGGNGGTIADGANAGVYKEISLTEQAYGLKGVFMQPGAANTGSGGGGGKGYEGYNRRSPAGKPGGSGLIIIKD